MARQVELFTIGHSTRTIDEFVALLQAHGVEQLVDVRTVPKSRRLPHFNTDALADRLPRDHIVYRHMPALGGLRKPRRDSRNTAWQNESFRGYADYMSSVEFKKGLDDLLAFASLAPTAIMCAEAVWWSCHRRLIADALIVRGVDVRHIMSATRAEPHELTPFARVHDRQVTYPGLLDTE
jgi:uncharacterized protein (DUF488 family)